MNFEMIDRNAAEDYENNIDLMIKYVDEYMLSRKDILAVVGVEGIEMMKINHRNHAAFMSIVFSLNRFELLETALPWVYRAYHNQGFSYAYFVIAMKAWINAGEKYLQPENLARIKNVYMSIIDRHEDTVVRSREKIPGKYEIEDRWLGVYNDFYGALRNGNTFECVKIASDVCTSSRDLAGFYCNVAQPSLYRVGELWEWGEISVADEHLATAIVSLVISQLAILIHPIFGEEKKAMVMSVTGEHHQVGAWMVAHCLENDGWNVHFLGDSVPLRDVMLHLTSFRPHLLAVSVTMVYNISAMKNLIQRIKSSGYFEGMKILAGGRAFSLFPDIPATMGADGYVKSCQDASLWARSMFPI